MTCSQSFLSMNLTAPAPMRPAGPMSLLWTACHCSLFFIFLSGKSISTTAVGQCLATGAEPGSDDVDLLADLVKLPPLDDADPPISIHSLAPSANVCASTLVRSCPAYVRTSMLAHYHRALLRPIATLALAPAPSAHVRASTLAH